VHTDDMPQDPERRAQWPSTSDPAIPAAGDDEFPRPECHIHNTPHQQRKDPCCVPFSRSRTGLCRLLLNCGGRDPYRPATSRCSCPVPAWGVLMIAHAWLEYDFAGRSIASVGQMFAQTGVPLVPPTFVQVTSRYL
jgi:hypothetical protein